jgi:hypothetical protein
MLAGLDAVPWRDLTHAYGSAEDVPELIRALQTAPPDASGEDSPLWHLFGNIWHQGTVYEATAYAVPFLVELAAEPSTPNRTGILHLLSAIAQGCSYSAVHGNLLNKLDFEAEKAQELAWAHNAHEAVAAAIQQFSEMTNEPGDLRIAAAHVLSQLRGRAGQVGPILRRLLANEREHTGRVGLILLLGQLGDPSDATMELLEDALDRAGDERRAAAVAIAHIGPRTLTPKARQAIIEALKMDYVEESFEGLPWDVAAEIDPEKLRSCLDDAGSQEVADTLIAQIAAGKANNSTVTNLLELLFPRPSRGPTQAVKAAALTPLQQRAVRGLAEALEGGKRIFYGSFRQWGLPDSRRQWKTLAAGIESPPVDMGI